MFKSWFINMTTQKKFLLFASLLLILLTCINLPLILTNQSRLFVVFRQARPSTKYCLISDNKRHNLSTGTNDSSLKVLKIENNTTFIKLDCPEAKNCDCDCCLLQYKLKNWPKEKPKAVIHFMALHRKIGQLITALQTLDNFFNNIYKYPIVIFYENDTHSEIDRLVISSKTRSEIYFQIVQFSMPDFLKFEESQMSIVECAKICSVGYRHMCRFHAFGVYEHPIMRGFEYAWRLDDDSEMLKPINFDVFKHMQDRHLKYGYLLTDFDTKDCIIGLWDAVRHYIKNNSVRTTNFFKEWKDGMIYYNNFEISAISLWLSDEYRKYFDFIDRQGGIYTHRWGDAPIKAIGVAMFTNKSETYLFNTIRYRHKTIQT